MSDPIILRQPNDAPPVDRVWMFVSRDSAGRENVIGSLIGYLGTQPLMTGNLKTLELMKPLAAAVAKQCEGSGQSIHLLCFTTREEVQGWR